MAINRVMKPLRSLSKGRKGEKANRLSVRSLGAGAGRGAKPS